MADLTVGRIEFGPHTAGPWHCGGLATGDWLIQSRDDHQPPWVVKEGTIAAVRGSENAEANARLIAAAPDLLAAVRAFIDFEQGAPRLMADVMKQAFAAIEKAEGR